MRAKVLYVSACCQCCCSYKYRFQLLTAHMLTVSYSAFVRMYLFVCPDFPVWLEIENCITNTWCVEVSLFVWIICATWTQWAHLKPQNMRANSGHSIVINIIIVFICRQRIKWIILLIMFACDRKTKIVRNKMRKKSTILIDQFTSFWMNITNFIHGRYYESLISELNRLLRFKHAHKCCHKMAVICQIPTIQWNKFGNPILKLATHARTAHTVDSGVQSLAMLFRHVTIVSKWRRPLTTSHRRLFSDWIEPGASHM